MSNQVDKRIADEKKAVRHLIRTMKKHNWLVVAVNDGEEVVTCRTEMDVMDNVFGVDESNIIFYNKAIDTKHVVAIVLGNSGAEVIADYSYNDANDFATIIQTEVDPYTEKLEH